MILYDADNFPVFLRHLIEEMQDEKHGRLFANQLPTYGWLIENRGIFDGVFKRGNQLWFLSIADFDTFNKKPGLAAAARLAGYETHCRELPDFIFAKGLPEHITLDPLHIVKDWIFNNNERKTA
jgi:hypothetical protein